MQRYALSGPASNAALDKPALEDTTGSIREIRIRSGY